MIKDFQELSREMGKATREETWDDNRYGYYNRIDYLNTLLDVYIQAEANAAAEGWVGVGCITYAEIAMRNYQKENPYEV